MPPDPPPTCAGVIRRDDRLIIDGEEHTVIHVSYSGTQLGMSRKKVHIIAVQELTQRKAELLLKATDPVCAGPRDADRLAAATSNMLRESAARAAERRRQAVDRELARAIAWGPPWS